MSRDVNKASELQSETWKNTVTIQQFPKVNNSKDHYVLLHNFYLIFLLFARWYNNPTVWGNPPVLETVSLLFTPEHCDSSQKHANKRFVKLRKTISLFKIPSFTPFQEEGSL